MFQLLSTQLSHRCLYVLLHPVVGLSHYLNAIYQVCVLYEVMLRKETMCKKTLVNNYWCWLIIVASVMTTL